MKKKGTLNLVYDEDKYSDESSLEDYRVSKDHAFVLKSCFPLTTNSYNKRQLSRVYPRGTRVDSSNFTPQVWTLNILLIPFKQLN